jgi:hypothetical protein
MGITVSSKKEVLDNNYFIDIIVFIENSRRLRQKYGLNQTSPTLAGQLS